MQRVCDPARLDSIGFVRSGAQDGQAVPFFDTSSSAIL